MTREQLIDNAWKTIWNTRHDLRQLCNDDPLLLTCWLAVHGWREYKVMDTFPPPFGVAFQPSPAARPDVGPTLTLALHFLWFSRPDLQQLFSLDTREGQQGFLWWYLFNAVPELGITHLVTQDQRDFFNQPDPTVPQDAGSPITRVMLELWRRHPDLQAAFRLDTAEGRAGYPDWYRIHGGTVSRLGTLLDAPPPPAPAIHPAREPLRPGVNLIGFARGELGIGEEVRMAALSMRAAGISCSVYNVDPGPQVRQEDRRLDALIAEDLPHSVNLFCMPGIDMASLIAREGGSLLEGRRNIGLWSWELPDWPQDWHHAYDLVDELWAPSRHTYEAFVRTCPKPVRHVPSCVVVDATEGARRANFGLPDNRFLFVFSFDVLSSFTRKNPMACVQAFKAAFPRGDEPVGLVVKAMRAPDDHPVWQALLAEAARDGRIRVISETLSRGAVLDLYRACDCFVSLHRAEGFGRGIAEAMMLGKPVIVTGYSGNLDFTTMATAALVDYRRTALSADDYPYCAGMSWAEPDVDQAAGWMRTLAANQELRQRLARNGQIATMEAYSPAMVGAHYAAKLAMPFR